MRSRSTFTVQGYKHRIIALIVAFSMLILPVYFPNTATAETNDANAVSNYFADDFSTSGYADGVKYQWKTDAYKTEIKDGAYYIDTSECTSGYYYDYSWMTAVTMGADGGEVDVSSTWTDYTFEADVTRLPTTATPAGLAGIVVRFNPATKTCYSFEIKNDRVILYKAWINDGGSMKYSPAVQNYSFKSDGNDTFRMKIEAKGNNIKCYVDGQLAIDWTDDGAKYGAAFLSGTAGMKMMDRGWSTKYDNASLTFAADISSVQDDFTDNRNEVGTSYQWVSTATGEDNWKVDNGAFTVGSGLSGKIVSLASATENYAEQWAEYTIESDFMLDGDASIAGVVVASTGSARYEVRLSSKKAELYSVSGTTETLLKSADAAIATGEWHFVKTELVGKTIKVSVDGAEVVSAEGAGALVGTAGLVGTNAKFDNFIIYPQSASASRQYGVHKFMGSDATSLTSNWNFDDISKWAIENNALVYKAADPVIGTASLKVKSAAQDYYAELVATTASETDKFGVLGRMSINGKDYYLLQLDLKKGLTLTKSVGGTETVLAEKSRADIYEHLGIIMVPGAEYALRLEMKGDSLQAYLNKELVLVITDAALAGGVSGIKSTQGVALSTLTIAEPTAVPPKLSFVYADGTAVENLQIVKGKVPDIKAMYLKVDTGSGEPERVLLDTIMGVSPFDASATGTVKIPVEYKGGKADFVYTVVERADEIAAIDKAIADLDLSNLTEEAVDALSVRYDDLTAAEKAGIDAANKEKLAAAQKAIDVKKYPQLEGYDVVFKDEFDTVASEDTYTNNLIFTGAAAAGNWYVENGYLYQYDNNDALRTGNSANGLVMRNRKFNVKSMSVDVMVIDPNIWFGMRLHYGDADNTYYNFQFSDKTNVGGGNRIQVYKNAKQLAATVETDPEKWVKPGQWNNMRIVFGDDGLFQFYVNDVLYLEYVDEPTAGYPLISTTGSVGLFTSEGWLAFDNLTIYGEELEYDCFDKINDDLNSGKYTDNFDDETAGKDPSHWIEYAYEEKWQVKEDGTNKVYALTDNTEGSSRTWLHGFERNLDFSVNVRVTDKGYYPNFGLTTRVGTETSYIRSGYDFELQKWFVKYRKAGNFDEVAIYAEKPDTTVDFSKWVNVRVKVVGPDLEIYRDGTLVLTADVSDMITVGRFGVYGERCDIEIDNVVINQLSGLSEVQDGVLDYHPKSMGVFADSPFQSYVTMPDGSMMIYDYGRHYVSSDDYKTFTQTSEYSHWQTRQTLRLHDGNYITIANNNNVFTCYHSLDGGKTWQTASVLPTEGKFGFTERQPTEFQMADGTWRIFMTIGVQGGEVQNRDGKYSYDKVYYSDDQGLTWKVSENSVADVMTNKMFGESVVIQVSKDVKDADGNVTIPKGTMVHMTTYNNSNGMKYTLSYDGGATWEGDYTIPELVSARGSCAVMEDPYEPGTYYMSSIYGYGAYAGNGNFRPGMALFRSYDGINWNFLCFVDRWDHVGGSLYHKVFHATNTTIGVSEDYVFPCFSRSDAWGSSNPLNESGFHYFRFAKADLVDQEMPAEYNIDPYAVTHIEAIPADEYTVNGEIGGQIKVYYYNGTTEIVDIADAFVTAPDMSTAGEKSVTVDYLYHRDIFTINVVTGDAPEISGAENDKTYCGQQIIEITDPNNDLASVTLNGNVTSLQDGKLVILPGTEMKEVVIVATDKAGNTTTVTFKINPAHKGGSATCEDKAICEACGEAYGELAADKHTKEAKWTITADKHAKAYECCGKVVVAEAAHKGGSATCKDKAKCEVCEAEYGELAAHKGGTATCTDKAKCEVCDKAYGELAADKHTKEAKWTKTDDKHSKTYDCCGKVVVAEEAHKLTDGKCECGYQAASGDNSQTGDNSNIVLFGSLLVLSVLAAGVLLIPDIRKRAMGK